MFELTILTPQGPAFSRAVEAVVLPGAEGELGVLEHHEQVVVALRSGPIQVTLADGRMEWLAISEGFAQIRGDRVSVLVDACLAVEDGPPADVGPRLDDLLHEIAKR